MGWCQLKVEVLFFALYRERAGKGTLALELRQGATVSDAVAQIREMYPQLAPPSVEIVTAVNTDYADGDHLLAEGDQVALIPPVSGGKL